jgi:AraC-like DNA-binding protein
MMVEDVCISTDFVEADERSDFWREVTRPVFEALPLAGDRHLPLQGSIRSRVIGSLLVGATSFNAQRYQRDQRLVLCSGLDQYAVQILTSGTLRGDFNGVAVSASAGDIYIFDLAQPMRGQVEAGATMSLTLPRSLLGKALGSRNPHGTVLKADWPITPLVTACVRGLCALGKPLPESQALAAQEAVVTLLVAALRGDVPDDAAEAASLGARLRQRIMEFMQRNLYLLELSPDFLCHRFNVSRAHLYRAFAVDGGVAKVLRDMRLDAAYRELTKLARTSRSITELAYSLGFSSGNQLLRSFRVRFGMTPSEARTSAVADTPWQGMDLQSYFARFARECVPA